MTQHRRLIAALAVCAAAAFAPRSAVHGVLAATAGMLFETAPFALLGAALPRRVRNLAGLVGLAGCGCGGRVGPPGALAPVAFAVCWLSFGPAPAAARALAAAAIATGSALGRRRPRPGASAAHAAGSFAASESDGALATLRDVAVCALAAALLAPALEAAALPPALALLGGIALGTIVPCATAGVALAAGCAVRDPSLAAGLLAASGIVPRVPLPGRPHGPTRTGNGRFALAALALALGALAVRGDGGFVHPRLRPLVALGAVVALAAAARPAPRTPRGALAVPAIMLVALVGGSPEPLYRADETTVLQGFPGEPVAFAGAARTDVVGGVRTTRIVRFSITCCRLDAVPQSVVLARAPGVPDGTWLRVRGRFAERRGTLVVVSERLERLERPADPFAYR